MFYIYKDHVYTFDETFEGAVTYANYRKGVGSLLIGLDDGSFYMGYHSKYSHKPRCRNAIKFPSPVNYAKEDCLFIGFHVALKNKMFHIMNHKKPRFSCRCKCNVIDSYCFEKKEGKKGELVQGEFIVLLMEDYTVSIFDNETLGQKKKKIWQEKQLCIHQPKSWKAKQICTHQLDAQISKIKLGENKRFLYMSLENNRFCVFDLQDNGRRVIDTQFEFDCTFSTVSYEDGLFSMILRKGGEANPQLDCYMFDRNGKQVFVLQDAAKIHSKHILQCHNKSYLVVITDKKTTDKMVLSIFDLADSKRLFDRTFSTEFFSGPLRVFFASRYLSQVARHICWYQLYGQIKRIIPDANFFYVKLKNNRFCGYMLDDGRKVLDVPFEDTCSKILHKKDFFYISSFHKRTVKLYVFESNEKKQVFSYEFEGQGEILYKNIVSHNNKRYLITVTSEGMLYVFNIAGDKRPIFQYPCRVDGIEINKVKMYKDRGIICIYTGFDMCVFDLDQYKSAFYNFDNPIHTYKIDYTDDFMFVALNWYDRNEKNKNDDDVGKVKLYRFSHDQTKNFSTLVFEEEDTHIKNIKCEKDLLCVDLEDGCYIAHLEDGDVACHLRFVFGSSSVSYYNYQEGPNGNLWHIEKKNNRFYLISLPPQWDDYLYRDDKHKEYFLFARKFKSNVVYATYMDGLLYLGLADGKFYIYDVSNNKTIFFHSFNSAINCGQIGEKHVCVGLKNSQCCILDFLDSVKDAADKEKYYKGPNILHRLQFAKQDVINNIICGEDDLLRIQVENDECPYTFDLKNKVKQVFTDDTNQKSVYTQANQDCKDRSEFLCAMYQDDADRAESFNAMYQDDEVAWLKTKDIVLQNKVKLYSPFFLLYQ